jgi:hypothetical protein
VDLVMPFYLFLSTFLSTFYPSFTPHFGRPSVRSVLLNLIASPVLWRYVSSMFLLICSNVVHKLTRTAENQWLHLPLITKLKKDCKEVFPTVEYAYTTIPTYPSGQIGFMVCCKDANRDVTKPLRNWTPEEEDKINRYYNADIHKASFILPTFARAALR